MFPEVSTSQQMTWLHRRNVTVQRTSFGTAWERTSAVVGGRRPCGRIKKWRWRSAQTDPQPRSGPPLGCCAHERVARADVYPKVVLPCLSRGAACLGVIPGVNYPDA